MFNVYKERNTDTAIKTVKMSKNSFRVGVMGIMTVCLLFMLAACEGGEKSVKLSPADGDFEVMGDLADNIVVSKKTPATLTLSGDNKTVKLKIPLELIKPVSVPWEGFELSIEAEVYDESRELVKFDRKNHEFTPYTPHSGVFSKSVEDFKTFLSKKTGSQMELELEIAVNNPESDIKEMLMGSKFFVLECNINALGVPYLRDYDDEDNDEGDEEEDDGDDEEEEEATVSNGANKDWDTVLKNYEEFVDKYIDMVKKAQKGDVSAMMEYVTYMEKASDLAIKLETAYDELTPAQMAKFLKLQTKLANAVAELYEHKNP